MVAEPLEPTRVQIETNEWRGSVALAESVPGGGDWSVVGVEVSALDGSALNAARLRAVPWGELLDRARAEIAADSRQSPFVRPSDLFLAAFTVDRRGKNARTERDYAELALAYLTFGQERGHKAASHWAKKYGNRSAQRWRMDLKRAKDTYIEEVEVLELDARTGELVSVPKLVLTEDAWLLIYGDDFFDVLEVEAAIEGTEEAIHRLESLGDGSVESDALAVRLDRRARKLTREHKVTITREVVRKAWLTQERQKLSRVNSPDAPD